MKNINVLMVISRFEPDLLSGNYRRMFELVTRCSKFGISYSTIEFMPLLINRSFIKKMLGYELPLYTVYISKGYGKGYDETRLLF
jgi:hypothetical protein